MKPGYKRTLEPADLFKLTDDLKVNTMTETFLRNFDQLLAKAKQKHLEAKFKLNGSNQPEDMEDFEVPKYIVVWAILYTFGRRFFLACMFLTLSNVAAATNPLLLKKLIAFVEVKALGLEHHMGKGIGYAIGTSLMVLINGLFINHAFHNSMLMGAMVKGVLTKALLEKTFRLSDKGRHDYPPGKITSMMGTDLARIDFALGFQPFLITFPVPIAIVIGILCHNIGGPAMVGVGLVLIFCVVMMAVTGKLFAYRKSANKYTDNRVDYVKEVLNNLRMIKFYCWEVPYAKVIGENRQREMKIVYTMQVARNIITSAAMCLTLFASMASFLVLYAVSGGTKSPADLFSSISLFNSLSQQVFMLPLALASGSDALVGFIRSGQFLAAEELDQNALETQATPEVRQAMEKRNLAIEVTNASFKWDTFAEEESEKSEGVQGIDHASPEETEKVVREEKFDSDSSSTALEATILESLSDINLEVEKGSFVAVTGVIGSGKSSLLSALAGFMKRTEGSVSVNGSLLFCDQPWIQNTTVKNNILFGCEFEKQRYKDVIYACSLEADLQILPAGDETEIGERGITLSGGQKARINLARAVYADKDIILLDDVLSAVDARVGKHIMENCVLGLLKEKTKVLATHQLALIGSALKIIFMNGDGTVDCGTFDDLKARNSGFEQLMKFNSTANEKEEEEEEEIEVIEATAMAEKENIERQLTRRSTRVTVEDEEAIHHDYAANNDKDGRLILDETRQQRSIKFAVYKNYVKFGSGIFKSYSIVPFMAILTAISVFCQLFTNTWLSFWSDRRFENMTNGQYIGLYVMFTVLAFVVLSIDFVALAYMCNKSATVLNLMAVQRILRVPMSYMDTTPMGRILNRFTKDTDSLDNEIGNQIRMLIYMGSFIIGVLILCVIYLPWFAIAIPFLVFIFCAVASFYQASAREIKRIEATQRSHVYNNFNETLSGQNTIKAYKAQGRFLSKNDILVDNMNEAYYITVANQRWLALHLDMVAFVLALIVCLLCTFHVFSISAASTGLLLSYVLQVAGLLSMLVRTQTQVENEMNAVERICEYAIDLPQEAPEHISETAPPDSWPEHGAIRFENVSLAYRPGLPLVLRKLNMDIAPHEKIGICGRTGAGKSSVMSALFRLSELSEGKIEIDGIDTGKLGLNDLRSKLSIIPQDPVLFKGTVRRNLDPFAISDDTLLWDSLARSGLIEMSKLALVKDQDKNSPNLHKFHLDREVEDGGSNFSLGERQLLSFARAMVRGSKILILDEATSSVDYETDSKIQETIVREFLHCTILCIAHRLKTIINYDRVLVLDKGEIREFDTPKNLFNLKNGIFRQMCDKSNINLSDFQ